MWIVSAIIKYCGKQKINCEKVVKYMKTKKILLTGGGTAGHVTPNLALLPYLKAEGYEIVYIGSQNGIERTLIEADGIPYYPQTPAEFSAIVKNCHANGASLLGGCCGTAPEYIAALRQCIG